MQADPSKTLGDVTTVNLTIINGGVQTNVVPDKYVCQTSNLIPDRSLPSGLSSPSTSGSRQPPISCSLKRTSGAWSLKQHSLYELEFRQWMEEAGSGLQLEFIQKFTDQTLTSTGFLSAVDIFHESRRGL